MTWGGNGQPLIRAVAATGLLDMVARHNLNGERLLAGSSVTPQDLTRPERQIPLPVYCELLERAARATGRDAFGLRYGQAQGFAVLGELGQLAAGAPTLEAALQAIARYLPALQEHSRITLRQHDGLARLSYQIWDGRIVARRQDAEFTITVLLVLMRRALGPFWGPEEVRFEHLRAADRADHQDVLRAPVSFGAATNTIVFRAALLRTPMAAPAPAAAPLLEAVLAGRAEEARRDDLVGLIQQEIRAALTDGEAGLPEVARRMGMAPATLYRRLLGQGLRYSDLVRGLRRELALGCLDQPHVSLTDIAELLGYAELSAFSRAFREWTGMAPTAWRRARADAREATPDDQFFRNG